MSPTSPRNLKPFDIQPFTHLRNMFRVARFHNAMDGHVADVVVAERAVMRDVHDARALIRCPGLTGRGNYFWFVFLGLQPKLSHGGLTARTGGHGLGLQPDR